MELLIIFILILFNGALSMSEIALVSARKTRLASSVKRGSKKARRALNLAENPDRFLPAIQIGITLVGIFLGVYSGENIADDLQRIIGKVGLLSPYSHTLAIAVVVVLITYLTLVLGELVPKRIGLTMPEKIARVMARPIDIFSAMARPFIWILDVSTRGVIRLLNIRPTDDDRVTEEEIKQIVEEGTRSGEVKEVERDIVDRVFILGDTEISALATRRNLIIWLEIDDTPEDILAKISGNMHHFFPVAGKNLENIQGVVSLKNLFLQMNRPGFELKKCMEEPGFMPETTSAYEAIRLFRERKTGYSLVVDEYGDMQGILTVNDILESLVGDVTPGGDDLQIIRRADGSFLVDGQYPFHEFLNYFDLEEFYEEYHYNTLSGLILELTGSIPATGDRIAWLGFELEIIDMDGPRIDKILVTPPPPHQ